MQMEIPAVIHRGSNLKAGISILLALCMTSLLLGTFWHQLSVIDQGVNELNAQMKHTVQALTQQLQVRCVVCGVMRPSRCFRRRTTVPRCSTRGCGNFKLTARS